MSVKLSKTFTQLDKQGLDESSLTFSVEYDRVNHEVVKVLGIEGYNHFTGKASDFTFIFREQFEEEMDALFDKIDWYEVYRESLFDVEVHDKDVVVHDSVSMIRSLQKHFT